MAHSVSKSYESVGTRNENSFIFRNVFSKYKENKKRAHQTSFKRYSRHELWKKVRIFKRKAIKVLRLSWTRRTFLETRLSLCFLFLTTKKETTETSVY